MTKRRIALEPRKYWTDAEKAVLRARAAPALYAALHALIAVTQQRDNPFDKGVSSAAPEVIAALAALALADGKTEK